jgi:hypothetical protein
MVAPLSAGKGVDMPNSEQTGSYNPGIEIGILRERQQAQGVQITQIDSRVGLLENEMRRGFSDVLVAFNSAKDETSRSLAAIRDELNNSRRPQWQALSVLLAVLVVVGGLVYLPVKQELSALKEDLAFQQTAMARIPSRDETEAWRRRAAEDRERVETAVTNLRTTSVPRGEYSERAESISERFADLARRIEDLRGTSTYGMRDILQRLEQKIDAVERERPKGE